MKCIYYDYPVIKIQIEKKLYFRHLFANIACMPKIVLNTRAQFDKQYTWESIQHKYFAQSLDALEPQTEIHITVSALRAMVIEAYEHGQIGARSASKPSPGKLKWIVLVTCLFRACWQLHLWKWFVALLRIFTYLGINTS